MDAVVLNRVSQGTPHRPELGANLYNRLVMILAWVLGVVLAVSLVSWALVLRGAVMLFQRPAPG